MDGTTIVTAIIGAITTITSTYITARIKNKTNAGLKKEVIQLRKHSPTLLPEEYGITIVTPADYEIVKNDFLVSGTYKKLPEGQEIWIASFEVLKDEQGKIEKYYWPQEKSTLNNGKWYSQVYHIGGNSGETKEFVALSVGQEGQALFRYFKEAGNKNEKWPPIKQLTSDIVKCAYGKIKLK